MESPNRWTALGDRLQHIAESSVREFTERPSYLSVQPATWEALTRHYFAEELSLRDSVDSAARVVATGRVPGNISNDTRYYLLLRIQCAQDFLGMAFPPQSAGSPFPDVPESWSDREAIEWLLIDLWVRRFDHWLKLTAISLAGPFAFYGIDPADLSIDA
jgi:hypothetical protein